MKANEFDHRSRAIDERSIINNQSWRGLRCSRQLGIVVAKHLDDVFR